MPSSDHRLYKYKNGYILNIINNYKPNVIINQKTNKYEYNLTHDKKDKDKNNNNENNISNNNSDTNSKKTNGASNNNINANNSNNLNNSLIHTENYLNTIAITLTNNNYNEKSIQSKYNKFSGLSSNGNRFCGTSNTSLTNLIIFSFKFFYDFISRIKRRKIF